MEIACIRGRALTVCTLKLHSPRGRISAPGKNMNARSGIYILIHGASRASIYICPAQPGIYEFRAAVRVAHEALNKYMPRVPKARVVYIFRRTRSPVYKVYIPESAEHCNKLVT